MNAELLTYFHTPVNLEHELLYPLWGNVMVETLIVPCLSWNTLKMASHFDNNGYNGRDAWQWQL